MPGKGSSGRNHNPFSALASSTAKSAASKQKCPEDNDDDDDDDVQKDPDYEALQPGSGHCRPLPANPLKKSNHQQETLRNLTDIAQVWWL